ncbi:hypothetical protein MCUN1_002496 [Malassezia cuniculi]|uniref:TLC domain-containing protein n=1 Tax=Malassezia cuniculi TaxID=948313 RepID=A0AAF0J6W9_9BASI|nr:hypothetical protein MCUN1_002496 [Malassezia cuniculi]
MLRASAALVDWLQPYADAAGLHYMPAHVPTILRSAIFWFSLQFISSGLSPLIWPTTIKNLNARGRTQWDIHVVSLLHSSIIGPLALYYWVYGVDGVDRVTGYDYNVAQVYAVSFGYFLWDIYVSVRYEGPAFVLHGLLAAIGMVFVYRPMLMIAGLSFLTWEASTPFLNIHWFLDKLGLTGSLAQLINAVFLLGSYMAVRLVLGIYQTYVIISAVWDPSNKFPLFQCLFYSFGSVALDVLNYIWFTKMVRAVAKRFRPKKE